MTIENEQELKVEELSLEKKTGFFSRFSKKGNGEIKDKKSKKEKTMPILVPDYLLMGFQEGVSKKDLLLYLRSKASEIGDPDLAKYQIIKKDNGFYWELHDCGSGHGALKDVLLELETKPTVVIKTSRKRIKISRNKKGGGLSIVILTNDEDELPTEGIQYKDKMSSMNSNGTGLLVFSSIFAFLGVISVLCSVTFKYGVLDKEKEVELPVAKVLPYSKIGTLEEFLTNEEKVKSGEYVKSLTLSNGKHYVVYTGNEEKVVSPDSAESLEKELDLQKTSKESMVKE